MIYDKLLVSPDIRISWNLSNFHSLIMWFFWSNMYWAIIIRSWVNWDSSHSEGSFEDSARKITIFSKNTTLSPHFRFCRQMHWIWSRIWIIISPFQTSTKTAMIQSWKALILCSLRVLQCSESSSLRSSEEIQFCWFLQILYLGKLQVQFKD